MKKYWISWWESANTQEPETCPFLYWVTGERSPRYSGPEVTHDEVSICAVIECEKEPWDYIQEYFPNVVEERFCDEKPLDWQPGDRFK